jgi:hypothetical protein
MLTVFIQFLIEVLVYKYTEGNSYSIYFKNMFFNCSQSLE